MPDKIRLHLVLKSNGDGRCSFRERLQKGEPYATRIEQRKNAHWSTFMKVRPGKQVVRTPLLSSFPRSATIGALPNTSDMQVTCPLAMVNASIHCPRESSFRNHRLDNTSPVQTAHLKISRRPDAINRYSAYRD